MPDIHIHIPLGFSGVLTIGDGGQVTVSSPDEPVAPPMPLSKAATAAASAWSTLDPATADLLETTLCAYAGYDPSTRVREIARRLVDGGWEAHPHPKGKYLRFVLAGPKHAPSIYLNTAALRGSAAELREFMLTLPEVGDAGGSAHMGINGDSFDQAVENIAAIEAWAGSNT